MLDEESSCRVYLACGPTDLRKSIDGLSALVKVCFNLDPFCDCLFVFCNRNKDKLKILRWAHNGFWLYYRRLERGKFQWPQQKANYETVSVQYRELCWLLDGLSLVQPKAHRAVKARTIV